MAYGEPRWQGEQGRVVRCHTPLLPMNPGTGETACATTPVSEKNFAAKRPWEDD